MAREEVRQLDVLLPVMLMDNFLEGFALHKCFTAWKTTLKCAFWSTALHLTTEASHLENSRRTGSLTI